MIYNWKTKSPKEIADLVLSNQGRFERRRVMFEPLWEKIVKVFRPRRSDILKKGIEEKGLQYGAQVFDQNPANSLSKFVSGKVGYMVNRAVPWIQFITSDYRLMQLDHIKQYLQDLSEQLLYAAGRSNFYSALIPHTLDADSVGTSVMIPMRDEKKDRVVFDVVHPQGTYLGIDEFGDVIIYHRKLVKTRLSALGLFGKDRLPASWFDEKGEIKELTHEDEYIWSVYPNDDRDNSSYLTTDKRHAVFCVLIEKAKTEGFNPLVYRSGRDFFPICYRSNRESGSEYGISIAADCLTSALVANKLAEKAIDAAHKAVDPPKVASKTAKAELMKAGYGRPGSVTWVDDIQKEGVKPWLDRLNWPISDAQLERVHAQIEDRMFIRFFEMLSAGDIKTRTAYEVSQMMAEKATLMSTIIDTFEQETLEPAIGILLQSESEAGRLPDPPEEILMTGGRVDVKYLGPLAQMQRSLLRSKGTIDALSIIGAMMQMSQEVGWVFNWRQMAEDVAIAQGMPQKLILSDIEQEELMRQQAEREQAMQEMAALEASGKASQGLSKRPEDGSPGSKFLTAANI